METTAEERQLKKIKKLKERNKALIYILKEDRNLSDTQIRFNYRIASLRRDLVSASSRFKLEYQKFKKAINDIYEIIKNSDAELTAAEIEKIIAICEEYKEIQPCKLTKMNYKKSFH